MGLEIEATFVEIDKDNVREKLKQAGAKLVRPEILMRRVVFDTGARNSFTRVRDEGERIVVTYKCHHDDTITGTEEINVEVNNYDDTVAILKASGLKVKAVQESYRESWVLDDTEIDIDTWPWIPSFIEIEGKTPDDVEKVASKLGFDVNEAIYNSVDEVYKLYYDVTNDYINFNLPVVQFENAPEFLAKNLREVPLVPAKVKANPVISKS